MNIRVDNTSIAEVTRTNTKTEVRGDVNVAVKETTTQQIQKDTGEKTENHGK